MILNQENESNTDISAYESAPKILIDQDAQIISYVDLFEAQLPQNQMPPTEESQQGQSHYASLMQNMIQRLERFGNLGYSDDYGQRRSNKRRKLNDGSIDPGANFYDLDDEWIDDEQAVSDEGDDKDYAKAIEKGFFSLAANKFKKKSPVLSTRKTKQRARRQKKGFPVAIKRLITKLEKIYKESGVKGKKLPAGANAVLKNIGQEIFNISREERDNTAQNVYQKISQILGVESKLVRMKINRAYLQLQKQEKYKQFQSAMGALTKLEADQIEEGKQKVYDNFREYVNAYNDLVKSNSSRGISQTLKYETELEVIKYNMSIDLADKQFLPTPQRIFHKMPRYSPHHFSIE